MGVNKLVGRYNPYSADSLPYLVRQNAKIREMNSLILRNSANLYQKIADPFGQNPYGEFGVDITAGPAAAGAAGAAGATAGVTTPMDTGAGQPSETTPAMPAEPPVAPNATDIGAGQQGILQQYSDVLEGYNQALQVYTQPATVEATDNLAELQAAPEAVQDPEPMYKYNKVSDAFCQGYYNIPWWSWQLNPLQQVALNALQTQGDDLIIGYHAANGKYPPLAEKFLLPTNIPKFTLYDYSDRQMIYLYYNRDPHRVPLGDQKYQLYAINWCNSLNKLYSNLGEDGITMTEADMNNLCRPDYISVPVYEVYAKGGKQVANPGGYITKDLCKTYKQSKNILAAPGGLNVYQPGTTDPVNELMLGQMAQEGMANIQIVNGNVISGSTF
jgi:hypothetical protein